jgi:hypothetical protein
MPTTTQETTRRTEAGYLAARAACDEARAAAYEAEAAKWEADPYTRPTNRTDMSAYYRAAAERSRALAAADREELAGLCICGGLGRIGDSLCRCQSEPLLSALGCEIHAEVAP